MTGQVPGKSRRKGISLVKIMDMFPSETAAEVWFAAARWPEGPHCPHCGSTDVQMGAKHKMPYRCREKACRKRFSVRIGTVMEGTNLSYREWAITICLCLTSLNGVSSMKLHRDLNITQKSAWHLAHRIREGFAMGDDVFSGPVKADEADMGGLRKNVSRTRRKGLAGTGRGAVGTATVAGASEPYSFTGFGFNPAGGQAEASHGEAGPLRLPAEQGRA